MLSSFSKELAIYLVAGCSLIPGFALAQQTNPGELTVLDIEPAAEFIDPQERISGGAAVGVVFIEANDEIQLDAAYVHFVEPVASPLELQISTVDGRYLATFDVESKTPPLSGWVKLSLSLKKPEFLANYKLNEIAALMTNVETGVAYPVRWGNNMHTDLVRVYINAEGAKSYFVTFDTEKNRLVSKSCVPASRRSSFKFDRICDVPVADIVDNQIEIIRKRGAGFGTSIHIPVLLPEPTGT